VSSEELLRKASPLLGNLGTLSEEPCWQRTREWPLEKLLGAIEAAGDSRLMSKAAVMEADLEVYPSIDEVFYRGLMDSLGYSANRGPMLEVATALPLDRLLLLPLGKSVEERATLLESILLGAGGLLPSQRPEVGQLDYLSSQYAGEVEAIWQAYARTAGLSGPVARGWAGDRVRPANSPARRLAAAARLLARFLWEPGGMLAPFLAALGAPSEGAANGDPGPSRRQGAASNLPTSPVDLGKQWTGMLGVPAGGYWGRHADFGQPLAGAGGSNSSAALVGSSRSADMVVNVLLPLLVAHADRNELPGVREAAMRVYAAYPKLEENRITRAMAEEALGPRKGRAINGARRQQGLMHLYKLYCEARRCYECPISGLVGR
jgi:hypothetical protein